MKKSLFVALLCLGSILVTYAAERQLQVAFSGTASTTDPNGRILTTPLDNRTLLRDFATTHGLSSTAGLGLAYQIGGNELGDTIDIINVNNGQRLYTLFGFYFGNDFGRRTLFSSSRRQSKRIEYVYTDQNAHSVGSALLTTYYFYDTTGNTNRMAVLGQMHYMKLGDATSTNVVICTGSFSAIRPWRQR
jgi:hypothetical protein